MDKEQLQGLITAEGTAVAERHKKDTEREARAAQARAVAAEIRGRSDNVVGSYRDFILTLAPDEVLTWPDEHDYHGKRKHDEALQQPAQVEINLGAYEDPTLGAGTAKATVVLVGAPGSDIAHTPYGSLEHAHGVSVSFDFTGTNRPYPYEVPLGKETFDTQAVMKDVYAPGSTVEREFALPGAAEKVEAMEATASGTMAYLTECVLDASLNEELAARYAARTSAPAEASGV